jgi:hypothetical protein
MSLLCDTELSTRKALPLPFGSSPDLLGYDNSNLEGYHAASISRVNIEVA